MVSCREGLQDKKTSESMAPAMDLMQLNPFVRRAVVLMTGLRLVHTADQFTLDVLTIIPGYVVWPALVLLVCSLGVP